MASNSSNTDKSNENTKESRWFFTDEQLLSTPSTDHGIDAEKEMELRQDAACMIQEMGQRLRVNQLCINTAIVYMHRFYVFHSFSKFPYTGMAMASLFLAAKVEEQPRKLESVIQVSQSYRPHDKDTNKDTAKATHRNIAEDLVFNENILLQTLGFDVAVDHPHTHIIKTCDLVKAYKDLKEASYFQASRSLHLTTMCLKYKPTIVACFCIHLACRRLGLEIPQSTEGKDWFSYVDKTVTIDLLKQLTDEYISIYERCPARLKSNSISTMSESSTPKSSHGTSSSQYRASSSHTSSSSSNHHQMKQNQRYPSEKSHQKVHHGSTSSIPSSHGREHGRQPEKTDRPVSSERPYPSTSGHRPPPSGEPATRQPHHNPSKGPTSGPVVPSQPTHHPHQQQKQSQPMHHPQHQPHQQRPATTSAASANKLDNRNINRDPKLHSNISSKNPSAHRMPGVGGSTQNVVARPPDQHSSSSAIQQTNVNERSRMHSGEMKNISSTTNRTEQQKLSVHNAQPQKQPQAHMHDMEHKHGKVSSHGQRATMADEPTIKKEQPQMHRPPLLLDKSMKMNRESITISGMEYDMTLPQNLLDTKPVKRPYNEILSQMDKNESFHREIKHRKTEIKSSPSRIDSRSSIGEPKMSSLNTIETNADLVSNLLKEGLADTKLGIFDEVKMSTHGAQHSNTMANFNMQQQMHSHQAYSMPKIEPITSHINLNVDRSSVMQGMQQFGSQHSMHGQSVDQYQKHSQLKQQKDMAQVQLPNKIKQEHTLSYHEQSQQPQLPMPVVQPQLHPHQLQPSLHQTKVSPESSGDQSKHHEKKKKKKDKKEKHKHKDKEKSKDREGRKKHKKDKKAHHDNHLSSDSTNDVPNAPIRLTISKEKLNMSQSDYLMPMAPQHQISPNDQLKLKIPKDRIKSDVMNYANQTHANLVNTHSSSVPSISTSTPSSSLKIKISKECLDVSKRAFNVSIQIFSKCQAKTKRGPYRAPSINILLISKCPLLSVELQQYEC